MNKIQKFSSECGSSNRAVRPGGVYHDRCRRRRCGGGAVLTGGSPVGVVGGAVVGGVIGHGM